eukprot:TRINITY_DN1439_c0_g1_i3.p1 TRINITY_DN1439_c0_g1~~TRINITY_DN1439_c0_g1_i3.p1  ORF type:complete len:154 (+),score=29.67 TRINITY_DN1439_c0_g1_i3:63-464(+)
MKFVLAATTLAATAFAYPVYSPGNGGTETCEGIACKAIDCKPPFKYKAPEETGTCCPLCWADEVKVPADRSWAKGMSGGIGMNNNADPILCRDVMCPPLHCPETEQSFDGRCCTKCASAAATTPADLAASYKV